MSILVSAFQPFFRVFHNPVMAKIATCSIRVNDINEEYSSGWYKDILAILLHLKI